MRGIVSIVFALAATVTLHAQESDSLLKREADSLRHSFGRQQVNHSDRKPGTPYADTLDTGNPAVKVVLYNNGSFRYVKDQAAMAADSVFTNAGIPAP